MGVHRSIRRCREWAGKGQTEKIKGPRPSASNQPPNPWRSLEPPPHHLLWHLLPRVLRKVPHLAPSSCCFLTTLPSSLTTRISASNMGPSTSTLHLPPLDLWPHSPFTLDCLLPFPLLMPMAPFSSSQSHTHLETASASRPSLSPPVSSHVSVHTTIMLY